MTEGTALMKQGIALLNKGTEASLREAIPFFDRAIAIRQRWIAPEDHWLAYLTAASWMNRGDALTRLGQPAELSEALRSYDAALAVLRDVPLEVNPLYRRRLAIAWMNRGITLQAQEAAASHAAAAESFEACIQVIRGFPEHAFIRACASMNLGNARLRVAPLDAEAALGAALEALRGLAEGVPEGSERLAGETGLKARYVVCQACAELLDQGLPPERREAVVSMATDAVEEGLALGRFWVGQGEPQFRPFLADFFRFGVRIYGAHQPQFLPEFVRENLDSSRPQSAVFEEPETLGFTAAALNEAARELRLDGFAEQNTPQVKLLLEMLQTLRFVEERQRQLASLTAG